MPNLRSSPMALGASAFDFGSTQLHPLGTYAEAAGGRGFRYVKAGAVDLVVRNWRAVMGAKGISAAQTVYWENALRKVVETAEWKADLEKNLLVDDFTTGAQLRKDLDRDHADMKSVLAELGLAKQ